MRTLRVAWLGVHLCLALGCLGQRGGSPAKAHARGAFGPWEPYTACPYAVPRPSPSGRWMAVHEEAGRLRVWELGLQGDIVGSPSGTPLWRDALQDCTWSGDALVYCGSTGLRDPHDLDMDPPPEGRARYEADHAQTAVWDPTTSAELATSAGGHMALLGHPNGELVAGVGPIERWWRLDGAPNWVDVIAVRDLAVASHFETALGADCRGGGDVGGTGALLGWAPHDAGIFVAGGRGGAVSPDKPEATVPMPVLLLVHLNGNVTELSNTGDLRLAGGRTWELPALAIVDDRTRVAGLLHHLGGMSAVGVFGVDGLVREYRFSVRYDFPPRLTEVSPWWRFIVCTPDGEHALFQEMRDPHDQQDGRGAPWWVYLWDLEQETYEPIVQMNEITYCFDWLSDTALIVGAQAEETPPDARTTELYDYGVLHLTKPEE